MPPEECRLSALNERPKSETKHTKRKLLHLESKACCGTELGNPQTTMFDVLRVYWLTIHCPRFSPIWDPIKIIKIHYSDSGIFLCIPVFCAWTCERFEEKQRKQVSGGAPAPGQTMETHQKVVERHKKVVDKHYKVVGWEVKYPKAGISCVLRISAKSIQKLWNKMCRIRASNLFFGQTLKLGNRMK